MPDIADQLDAAIGAAPSDAPSLEPTLVLGRRALRRQRLAYGLGALTTALVIGGTAWAVSPGDDGPRRSQDPDFGEQTSSSAPPPASEPADAGVPWVGADAVRLDRRGDVEVKPGWTLTQRIDEVNGPGTLGLEVAKRDRLQWFLFGRAMTISSLHAPSEGYATFEEWIDVNGPLIEGTDGTGDNQTSPHGDWPGVPRDDLVRWAPDALSVTAGLLPAGEDVTIVAERQGADLGASFAPPSETSVAKVRMNGLIWYVVARRTDDYIAVSASDAWTQYGVENLDEFIDFARERYAEGGGGLL